MLSLENVSVKYEGSGDRHALAEVSFSLNAGERAALIGANGAGKSTLLLALVGVLPLLGGSVKLDDAVLDKHSLPRIRREAGLLFQNPDDQLFMPTVYEDIAFGPRNYGLAEAEIAEKISAAMAALGIEHLSGRLSQQLSGGEKRLAALAGLLVLQPRLLLLDEPSSFLDPRARRRLTGILGGLPQAMLLATHDIELALALCPRGILLKEGRVLADGPLNELMQNKTLLEEAGL